MIYKMRTEVPIVYDISSYLVFSAFGICGVCWRLALLWLRVLMFLCVAAVVFVTLEGQHIDIHSNAYMHYVTLMEEAF